MRCSVVVRVLNNDTFLDTSLSVNIITQIYHNSDLAQHYEAAADLA